MKWWIFLGALILVLGSFYDFAKTIYRIIQGHQGKLRYIYTIGCGLETISFFLMFEMLVYDYAPMVEFMGMSLFVGGTMMGYVLKKVYKIKNEVFTYNFAKPVYWIGIFGIVVMILMIFFSFLS
jgi:hypothetical protein